MSSLLHLPACDSCVRQICITIFIPHFTNQETGAPTGFGVINQGHLAISTPQGLVSIFTFFKKIGNIYTRMVTNSKYKNVYRMNKCFSHSWSPSISFSGRGSAVCINYKRSIHY